MKTREVFLVQDLWTGVYKGWKTCSGMILRVYPQKKNNIRREEGIFFNIFTTTKGKVMNFHFILDSCSLFDNMLLLKKWELPSCRPRYSSDTTTSSTRPTWTTCSVLDLQQTKSSRWNGGFSDMGYSDVFVVMFSEIKVGTPPWDIPLKTKCRVSSFNMGALSTQWRTWTHSRRHYIWISTATIFG